MRNYLYIFSFIILGLCGCSYELNHQKAGEIPNFYKSFCDNWILVEYKKLPENHLEQYWLNTCRYIGAINSWKLKMDSVEIFPLRYHKFGGKKDNLFPLCDRNFVFFDSILYTSTRKYTDKYNSPQIDLRFVPGDTLYEYVDSDGLKKYPRIFRGMDSCLGAFNCYHWDRIRSDNGSVMYSITFLYEIGVYEYISYKKGYEEHWVLTKINGKNIDKWLKKHKNGGTILFSPDMPLKPRIRY